MSTKNPEDEYFARLEAEKTRRLAAILADQTRNDDAEELKQLHYHHCGKCGHEMFTTQFRGVEVEVCPQCGAVLLDPGELQELAGEDHTGAIQLVARLFGFSRKK